MKRRSEELYGTNFEFLRRAFPDLIDSIEDGFFGDEPSKGPRRYPNFVHHDLYSILEAIFIFMEIDKQRDLDK